MKITVLCPMVREKQNFLSSLPEVTKNSYKVVHSGVGKVNAAATTATEALEFPDLFVVVGYAASSPYYKQGDLVIPSSARYHDVHVPEGCVPEIEQSYPLAGNDACTIYTGDSFITAESASEISSRFNAPICLYDMEATAVAQAASEYNIPVLVLKLVSDVPQSGHSVQSFEDFVNTHTDFSQFVNYLEGLV